MQVLLLCGGRGIIDPETRMRIPKGMLKVGNKPLIWHVMKLFSSYGHTDFVLALGQGGDIIRSFFLNAFEYLHDVEINLVNKEVHALNQIPEEKWSIKFVDTGISARTGARIARCERYLRYDPFFISYSDILSDVRIDKLLEHHIQANKTLTITGVNPPSRFGTFYLQDDKPVGYNANATLDMNSSKLNGGFMIANENIFKSLSPLTECNLETEVFNHLIVESEVSVLNHDGFWQNVDTERDLEYLQSLYDINKRPWLGIY